MDQKTTLGTNTSLTFTITNSGNANLTNLLITINGTDAAMFIVTTNPATSVSPNSNTTFTVRFTPASTGVKIAALHIASNATNNPFNINLTGTGTNATAPIIGVQQPLGTNLVNGVTNNFGSVTLGTNTSLTFTITNSGNANLTNLLITINGTDAAMFIVTTNPATSVSPNSNTTFTVRFTPASTGVKIAALHIASNATNNPFNINLTGTGTNATAPIIGVQQPLGTNLVNGVTNNFGSVTLGTNTSLTFTITNSGNANLTNLLITINGTDAAMFIVTTNPATSVSPNSNTTFTVRFTPASTGVKIAALHIASNATNNPFNINLTGTGTNATAPIIGVQQPLGTNLVNGVTNNFGSVTLGTNTSLTFTITNSGNANLTGLVITIDGSNSVLFTVTTNPIAPLNPGSNTTFTVRFAPVSTGVKTAALHIANNDTNNNPFTIALAGTGTNGVVLVSTNLLVTAASPVTQNPQTGLFEQTVRVTNSSPGTVAGVRLYILSLPADVQVYNASGRTNGIPYLQYNLPLASAATVDFVIEYYRASRQPIPSPVFIVEEIIPVSLTVTNGVGIRISNITLTNGAILIGFYAAPGHTYAVQYSSDTINWLTANPFIIAPANYVQWIDSGPPKTQSFPASRYYRAFEVP